MERQQATPETLKLVWEGMVGNDRMRRYYSYLIKHYQAWNRRLRWIAAILASGPLIAFLYKEKFDNLDTSVSIVFFAAAALNIWLAESRVPESIAHCLDIHRQLSRLDVEWRDLWASVYHDRDDVVRSKWKDLSNQTAAVVSEAPSKASYVKRLASLSEKESYEYWRAASAQV